MTGLRAPGSLPWVVAFGVLQCGSWFAMFASNRHWLGSWRMALDWAAGSVVITGPLLAGLAAAWCAAWRGSALPDLVDTAVRPHWARLGPAVLLWSAAVASTGVVAAAVTVRALVLGVPVHPDQVLVLVPAALVLGTHVLLGVLVGLRAGGRVGPLIAVLGAFALFLLATRHLAPPSFVTGGATGSLVGQQYAAGAWWLLLGYAGLSMVVVLPWVLQLRHRWVPVAVSAGAGVALLALAGVGWPDLEERFEPAAVTLRCAGEGPRVCVAADTAHALDRAARRMDVLAQPLLDVGVRLPDRWVHVLPRRAPDPRAGALLVPLAAEWGGQLADADLVRSLAVPASCAALFDGSEPPASVEARALLVRWIMGANGLGRRDEPWVTATRTQEWVLRTYARLRSCDLGALRTP